MNIGFLGCSKIGVAALTSIKNYKEATLYACASRELNKAEEYKNKYGFEHAYGSYEELVNDPNVDLIYISTITSLHYEHTKLCLEHNKPCLVEKPFTTNAKEAEELFKLAKSKNIFVGEAMWTRYMPSRGIINNILQSGVIGDIYMLSANLSYKIDGVERLIKKDLGGGILYDCGVYPINFAFMILGSDYKNLKSTMIFKGKGVDETTLINMFYKNGIVANLYTSMNGNSDRNGFVYGSRGYLKVDNINNPSLIEIYGKVDENSGSNAMELKNSIRIKEDVNGMEYEFYESILAIKSKIIEPVSMPHSETIKVLKLIDKVKSSSFIVDN